jgi:hypothetical protein
MGAGPRPTLHDSLATKTNCKLATKNTKRHKGVKQSSQAIFVFFVFSVFFVANSFLLSPLSWPLAVMNPGVVPTHWKSPSSPSSWLEKSHVSQDAGDGRDEEGTPVKGGDLVSEHEGAFPLTTIRA